MISYRVTIVSGENRCDRTVDAANEKDAAALALKQNGDPNAKVVRARPSRQADAEEKAEQAAHLKRVKEQKEKARR